MPLTDTEVKNAKGREKPYKLFDGGGLFLLVNPDGSKYWRLKYRDAQGKEKLLALGVYPAVPLAGRPDQALGDPDRGGWLDGARDKREAARKQLAAGLDPSAAKKAAKLAREGAHLFETVARDWMARAKTNGKRGNGERAPWSERHEARVTKFLEADLLPTLGKMPVNEIRAPDILRALRQVEGREALVTARKVRGVASAILGYAVSVGLAERNPVTDLPRDVLASRPVKHHASITEPAAVGQLLRDIRGYTGYYATKAALELLPLLLVRPGELRNAEWHEFDLDGATWNIPAGRMKMRDAHTVPLPAQAVATLRTLHTTTGKNRIVFPGVRHHDKVMSENTLNAALRALGYNADQITGHGFRAMARTMLDEQLGFRVDYIEHQLAHAVKDPNGRAYNRTKFLPERRKMLQAWADYLDRLARGGKVLTMKRKAQGGDT